VEAYLRAWGAPTAIGLLGQKFPLPDGVGVGLLEFLASDDRFELHHFGGKGCTVRMRATAPAAETPSGSPSEVRWCKLRIICSMG
jgi:hypothetical protein